MMEMEKIETKEIITIKNNEKIGDFYAISILKALYPEAKVIEIDPNTEEGKKIIEEAKRDSSKILIGIEEYNPDLRNYNDPYREKSTLKIVLENEVLEDIIQNPILKEAFEVIDYIDREGYKKAIREYGIENNLLIQGLLENLKEEKYNPKIGEAILKKYKDLKEEDIVNAIKEIYKEIESKEIIEEIKKEYWTSNSRKIKELIEKEKDKKGKVIFSSYYSIGGKFVGLLFWTIKNSENGIDKSIKKFKEKIVEKVEGKISKQDKPFIEQLKKKKSKP
jgi:hypothetical protein